MGSYNKQIDLIFRELGICRSRGIRDVPSSSAISMDKPRFPKRIEKRGEVDKWMAHKRKMGWDYSKRPRAEEGERG